MSRRLPADLAMLNAATVGLRAHAWKQGDPDIRAWLEGVAAVADRVVRRYSRDIVFVMPSGGASSYFRITVTHGGYWRGHSLHPNRSEAIRHAAKIRRRLRSRP